MGLEIQSADGATLAFRRPAVVGRAPESALCLELRQVSSHHAELRWVDGSWAVRDLGSTNGTYVDGRRLGPGESHVLTVGSRLGFAQVDGWTVVAARQPQWAAHAADGVEAVASGGVIAIPNTAEPQVTVVPSRDGWIAEWADGRTEATADGAVLDVGGVSWTLSLPNTAESTSELCEAPYLHDVGLSFYVSRDEEHVQTRVLVRGSEHELPARTHHYTLLTLARCRLQDQQRGDLDDAEQGWVLQSRLEQMLACGQNVVYKHIFRSRRELAELGVANASDIVERRAAAGQLRIGVRDLSVQRG